jgi:hypothetical protein
MKSIALALLVVPAFAVIVDRIAITVGNKIITDSEINQRIRLAAFQNDQKPDFSLASRRQAAQTLIDQKLVEREMDVGHYPRLEEEAREELLSAYRETNYKSDPGALDKAAAAYGLTPEDIEGELGRQSELLSFLNLRFRPAVQVTDQDIQKAGGSEETRAQIEQKLALERADQELDRWLTDQRKRTRIDYAEKELEPGGKDPGDKDSQK